MANFNFKSPSVKTQEIDRSFASTPSLGITSVGIVGETLKGPAFSPLLVTTKAEFRRYFGGTSTEKFPDGSGKMKYLAPLYANSFLDEGDQLYFTRVLGKSGYDAGPGWAIRVGSTVSSSGVSLTQTGDSVLISSSTLFGVSIVTATASTGTSFTNLSITFDRTGYIATAQTYDITVSSFTESSTTINYSTSGLSVTDTGTTPTYSGVSFLGFTISSATGSSFTNFNNLSAFTWSYVSANNTYSASTTFLQVSGYVESSQTSYVNFSSYTYSAASIVTPASGFATYSAVTYSGLSNIAYDNMVVAILRSRGSGLYYDSSNTYLISSVTGTFTGASASALGNFSITAFTTASGGTPEVLQFNLDSTSSNFITKAMGRKNSDSKSTLFCEAVYPDLIRKLATDGNISSVKDIVTLNEGSAFDSNYRTQFKTPETPWLVSELNGNKLTRLFKFISYSDGDSANKEIKIAIENINPTTKEFDVIVRDYNDTDANPSILERFGRCVMNPASNNFIMRKIGGVYSNAEDSFLEDARSAYVYVNVNINAPSTSFPCGFEGYQLPLYNQTTMNNVGVSAATPVMVYKTSYLSTDKPLKTYLGISEKAFDTTGTKGLSINDDLFKFYGDNVTFGGASSYKTKGFHLDSDATGLYKDSQGNILGEFVVGAGKISNSTDVNSGAYQDPNKRKFVLVPYGGFDGWDIYYEVTGGRSIGSSFALGGANADFDESDYKAYLEGYQIYEDTERTPINLFATPGINWNDNLGLVEDVVEIVEEVRQDALYIIDAPDANLNDTPTTVAGTYADDLESAGIDSSYAATFVPWIRKKDPDSNTNIYVPPTGDILKAMALADRTSFIWFATAGLNRGGLPDARDVRKTFKESDRDTLYLARLNPIVKFSNNTPGVFIYGQKTLQVADSKLDRIDVRRLLLYAKQIISSQARLYLFEPNDDVLATNFITESNKRLKVIQDNRGLQTFSVRLDNTLNTPESRDRNEIYFVIELLPIGAVEFIGLTFVVNKSTTSIQFNA
jgi:hypothetical protein